MQTNSFPGALSERLKKLKEAASPSTRQAALLSVLLNVSLIPNSDFIAVHSSRDEAIQTLTDEIMLWQPSE